MKPTSTPPAGWQWVEDPDWESAREDGERGWVLVRIPDYVAPAPRPGEPGSGYMPGSDQDPIVITQKKREANRIQQAKDTYLAGGGGWVPYTTAEGGQGYKQTSYIDDQGVVHNMDGSVSLGQPQRYGGTQTPRTRAGSGPSPASQSKPVTFSFTPKDTTPAPPKQEPAYTGRVATPVPAKANPWMPESWSRRLGRRSVGQGRRSRFSWTPRI